MPGGNRRLELSDGISSGFDLADGHAIRRGNGERTQTRMTRLLELERLQLRAVSCIVELERDRGRSEAHGDLGVE